MRRAVATALGSFLLFPVMRFLLAVLLLLLGSMDSLWACADCGKNGPKPGQRVVALDLHIREEAVSHDGRGRAAMTINGTIPGPTLEFTEGDFARIRVHNHLRRGTTSLHWHGLLLPNPQDGVPHVTTPPIAAGGSHEFGFTLSHAGTYWYHSHSGFQEQQGVYGAIRVLPKGGAQPHTDHDVVAILSDWTSIHSKEVMRMLMRGSDYFGLMRRNAQSLSGAAHAGMVREYFAREWDRMPPMDLSDVGYDRFLVNGQPQIQLPGKAGETIRLRLVNAAAATYFHVSSSTADVRIVAADGMDVVPVRSGTFLMAIAETYDLMLTIPASGQHELRFTAQDGSGSMRAVFGSGSPQTAPVPPRAQLYSMNQMLELALAEQEDDPRAPLALERPGSPYRLLRARSATSLPRNLPRRRIALRLTGDMNRYIWSFNGQTIAGDPYLKIRRGENVELELSNDSMMHHPIHLHGHFFRLVNGQGSRSPLKHTVDVPPMGKRLIEFEANESADWLLHCHILYHMMSGMARVVRYEDDKSTAIEADDSVHGQTSLGEHGHDMSYLWGAASVTSQMSEGLLTWMNPRNDLMLAWETGWGRSDRTEYEVDLLYQRYFDANHQVFAGYRFANQDGARDRAILGANLRLPLLFWATATIDSRGDARFQLAKRIQLTPRLSTWAEIFYDTGTTWESSAGIDLTLNRSLSLSSSWHSDYGPGIGLSFRF
jgi:FtsP/CotA-like multicopper oxidase with cupredoxin domain